MSAVPPLCAFIPPIPPSESCQWWHTHAQQSEGDLMKAVVTRPHWPGQPRLGVETRDDDQATARLNLAHCVEDEIWRMELTEGEATRLLDVDRLKVSRLLNPRLEERSPHLIRFLAPLGFDVDIVVGSAAARVGPTRPGPLRVLSREGALQ